MPSANALEESYLKHIMIAVEVGDASAPFRTFFDSWFAFYTGGPFLNSNSRPHWHNNPDPNRHGAALRRAHFVSAEAASTLAGLGSERLVKDHAVPVSSLRDLMFQQCPASVEETRAILLKHYRIGVITSSEDARLTAGGLRSRMPEGWTTQQSTLARYEQAGISAQDISATRAGDLTSGDTSAVKCQTPKSARMSLLQSASSPLVWRGGSRD